MTTTPTETAKPLYRISFARITGKDQSGKETLSRPKEIGAVWPRKGDKKGGVVSLDLILIELTQRQGVLFLVPVEADEGGSL